MIFSSHVLKNFHSFFVFLFLSKTLLKSEKDALEYTRFVLQNTLNKRLQLYLSKKEKEKKITAVNKLINKEYLL